MDENKTAQTKEVSDGASAHGDAGVSANGNVESNGVGEENSTDFSDTSKKEESSSGGGSNAAKARNAEAAHRRREAERQKELRAERVKTIIDTLGGINPYTDEPMKDEFDVEEYEAMRAIEKDGGDPVGDVRKRNKEKLRSDAQEQQKKAEKDAFYAKDTADFRAAYPDVDLHELIANEKFAIFAEGKVGNMPLAKIYEGYLSFSGEKETNQKAKQMAKQMLANKKASPGSLSDSADATGKFFTREQVKAMSPAEVSRNYDTIRESMKKW